MPSPQFRRETITVHEGRPADLPDAPLNEPVTFTSTYVGGGALGYGRYANPNWTAFESTLGALEGGECRAFASGMAASTAITNLVSSGGVIVVPQHSYLGTLGLLDSEAAQRNLTIRRVDVADTAAVLAAIEGAELVWIESPTNPALEIVDIEAVAAASASAGALLVVDNTFATPLLQRPLELGADLVIHSATKLIAGHSDVILGAVVAKDAAIIERIDQYRRLRGAIPGPMETFLALRGLRTLHVRLDRASENTRIIAKRIAEHPRVCEVRDPGFGTVISVVLDDADSADAFVEGCALWVHATSLGGVESTLERRRRWAGEAPSIPEGLVRLSVGIEHVGDLLDDLRASLDAISS